MPCLELRIADIHNPCTTSNAENTIAAFQIEKNEFKELSLYQL